MLPKKMKSVAVVDKEKVELLESRLPDMLPHDILIKIRGAMLCTFEQRIFKGIVPMPLPFVPGHEVVGEIAALGESVNEKRFKVGQKVVAKLLYACGECQYCREGLENLCESRSKDVNRSELMGMGGLSEYTAIDARQVWVVDEKLNDNVAIFAEPLACVVNSVTQANIKLGEDVLVIGGGIMGQLHILVSKLRGARVIMSEPNEKRRKVALKLGADYVINPLKENLKEFIGQLTNNYGVNVVFNTTAVSEVLADSLTVMASGARNIAYSSQHPDKPFLVSANWLHDKQPILTGAVSPTIDSFHKAVKLLNKNLIDPTLLIDEEYPLEECQKAFERAILPSTYRIKINFIK